MQDTNSRQGACLPPDFHSLFVVGAKEVIGAVMLHCLTAILPYIENCRRKVKIIKPRRTHQLKSVCSSQ